MGTAAAVGKVCPTASSAQLFIARTHSSRSVPLRILFTMYDLMPFLIK
jgi:hypothetical protein